MLDIIRQTDKKDLIRGAIQLHDIGYLDEKTYTVSLSVICGSILEEYLNDIYMDYIKKLSDYCAFMKD